MSDDVKAFVSTLQDEGWSLYASGRSDLAMVYWTIAARLSILVNNKEG